MFKSFIANVGDALKHVLCFSVCLLSSIIGLFFMYLGFTGSWDGMTIIMSLLGVMGMVCVMSYLPAIMAWVQESLDQAKRAGVIRTGMPSWAMDDPRFDPEATEEEEPEGTVTGFGPIKDYTKITYKQQLRQVLKSFLDSARNAESEEEWTHYMRWAHRIQCKLDEHIREMEQLHFPEDECREYDDRIYGKLKNKVNNSKSRSHTGKEKRRDKRKDSWD